MGPFIQSINFPLQSVQKAAITPTFLDAQHLLWFIPLLEILGDTLFSLRVLIFQVSECQKFSFVFYPPFSLQSQYKICTYLLRIASYEGFHLHLQKLSYWCIISGVTCMQNLKNTRFPNIECRAKHSRYGCLTTRRNHVVSHHFFSQRVVYRWLDVRTIQERFGELEPWILVETTSCRRFNPSVLP